MHAKTHFKAAQEYIIVEKHSNNNSLIDHRREIEKQVEDANFHLQAKLMKIAPLGRRIPHKYSQDAATYENDSIGMASQDGSRIGAAADLLYNNSVTGDEGLDAKY